MRGREDIEGLGHNGIAVGEFSVPGRVGNGVPVEIEKHDAGRPGEALQRKWIKTGDEVGDSGVEDSGEQISDVALRTLADRQLPGLFDEGMDAVGDGKDERNGGCVLESHAAVQPGGGLFQVKIAGARCKDFAAQHGQSGPGAATV